MNKEFFTYITLTSFWILNYIHKSPYVLCRVIAHNFLKISHIKDNKEKIIEIFRDL